MSAVTRAPRDPYEIAWMVFVLTVVACACAVIIAHTVEKITQ